MLKVYMEPRYNKPDCAEGGIRRVVEAQVKHLPEYGVRIVDDLDQADLTAGHGVLLPKRVDLPFVSHCHGLYWREYEWGSWAQQVNRAVVEAMVQAQAVTAPSKWVAGAIMRGMYVKPQVIYHGVDVSEWQPEDENLNYALWNKARADSVSDPRDMQRLAEAAPDLQFLSTVGDHAPNVDICGVVPLPQMRQIIQRAGVYLCTARETFGIGTLEALACGVPVAGWRYGGQEEIIVEGETGYLAPFGDYEALAECVRLCLRERPRLSANCRQDVIERWQWSDKIKQYADLYKAVYAEWTMPLPKVSVIVPCYNLGKFLPAALDSVKEQTLQDWECVIVDDCSTDNSLEIAAQYTTDPRFHLVRPEKNGGLCKSLNLGAQKSIGKYLLNFDADNLLPPDTLQTLAQALDERPDLDIVYGALDTIHGDDMEGRQRNPWPGQFDWRQQMAHINQIHSGAMMRREVRELSGGYRARMWRAEDAEFWSRVTSFGFRAARVTDKTTLIYRFRPDSKGQVEYRENPDMDGNWVGWLPWALAGDAKTGAQRIADGAGINENLTPFGAQIDMGAKKFLPVSHQQEPLVSVIIPLGPHHVDLVIDALDSLVAQNFQKWEAIVVNNTGKPLAEIPGAPWARIIDSQRAEVGAARNAGIKAARGELVYFLDADDFLMPGDSLSAMLRLYAEGKHGYIYSDYVEVGTKRGDEKIVHLPEYRQEEWRGQHAVNMLIAKADAERVGMFDETISGWEDWDFFCRLAIKGICGKRLEVPAFAYRKHTGTRRDDSLTRTNELLAYLKARFGAYYDGDRKMGKCCGGNANAVLKARQIVEANDKANGPSFWMHPKPTNTTTPRGPLPEKKAPTTGITASVVRMEYTGAAAGAITFFGKNGRQYRGGNNPKNRYANVHHEDVETLLKSNRWRLVVRKAEEVKPAAPAPEPVPEMPAPTPEPMVSKPEEPTAAVVAETLPVAPIIENEPEPPAKETKKRSKRK